MSKMKIGFLPLYLELYDECCADRRPQIEAFADTIIAEYEKRGLEVVAAPVCRIKSEFTEAFKKFESSELDAVITLHLAYSPSLESIDILAGTELPLIILDTTPDFEFGPEQCASKIMYNHGIHGVQDMCNMLIRYGKDFMIEAGHWQESDVIDRTVKDVTAVKLAANMRNSRIGIIGKPFAGMGDFNIPYETLKKVIGIKVVETEPVEISVNDCEVDEVIAEDAKLYDTNDLPEVVHRRSIAADMMVRKWIEDNKLTGFTFNFRDIDKNSALPTVPFYSTSKLMAEEIGYAGEGDVLNAALTGAFTKEFPEVTFTEMFCPDWKGNRVFMSHMGEISLSACHGKAVLKERQFDFTDAENPAYFAGKLKAGEALLINLAPGPNDIFTLLTAPVSVCSPENADKMENAVAGWIKPQQELSVFLQNYSKLGGTHHSVLIYNCDADIIANFAKLMNWNYALLD